MKLQDTLSNSEQELDISKKVKIYLCGVTVYDESHIGHARTIIVFDVLRKYLEKKGIEIEFIQNFTDVDDRIINRAQTENTTAERISTRYIENYFKDFDGLNVKRATNYPKATEHIDEIIKFIEKLIEKQIAYTSKNGVYFSISKFPEYGKLSKKKIDELQSGARIEVDETKKDPLDFALWKFSDVEPVWDTPWGKGRPGWHIECSAMSIKYLGENFDIHGGGRDLIFPHHENEIAQSESCTGSPFAKIWMHVGMVTINGEKMSKSLGNTKSINFVLKKWGSNIVRFFCLNGVYSKPIDYSDSILEEYVIKWRKFKTAYFQITQAQEKSPEDEDEYRGATSQLRDVVGTIEQKFENALNNNLHTRDALNEVGKLVGYVLTLSSQNMLDKEMAKIVKTPFRDMIEILGFTLEEISEIELKKIRDKLQMRDIFRQEKKFEDADKIREELTVSYELIDQINKTIIYKLEHNFENIKY